MRVIKLNPPTVTTKTSELCGLVIYTRHWGVYYEGSVLVIMLCLLGWYLDSSLDPEL